MRLHVSVLLAAVLGIVPMQMVSAQVSSATLPRIGVRVIAGAGELYDRVSGKRFVPRGNNFIRLAPQLDSAGQTIVYHSLFNIGQYSHDDIESNLARMQASGYNSVRVFLDQLAIGDPSGGLSARYLDNVADFLRRSANHGIYVVIAADFTPTTPEYQQLIYAGCCDPFENAFNITFLSASGLEANRLFWRAFISELQARGAPLTAILSYQLTNEGSFYSNAKPFTLTSGIVTTANGKSYDMGTATGKQVMMDENIVYWNDSLRATILALDADALVSNSFLVPQLPNPDRIGDPRVINTRPAIISSKLDFVDLHPYPGNLTIAQYAQNYGLPSVSAKPIIMGEFGVNEADFPSLTTSAGVLQDWQVRSCQYGFVGWLLWTWDLERMPNSIYWSALSGNAVIDDALSPVNRPDACERGAYTGQDLALDGTATASGSAAGFEPRKAIDGSFQTIWISGALPPQWIEIRLARMSDVAEIRLTTHQPPEYLTTTHNVYTQSFGGTFKLVHQFKGVTQDDQTLSWIPEPLLKDVIALRVETIETPSWVAWKEIEVISAKTRPPTRTVVEFYNLSLDHYFISWAPGEIEILDSGTPAGWARTGQSFKALIAGQPGASPICRFYIPPQRGDSHFFGRGAAECAATAQANPTFILESAEFMNMLLPTSGTCPENATSVYRVFSNRPDANHRYMTDKTLRQQMLDTGWLVEGDGPDAVVMCAPQ